MTLQDALGRLEALQQEWRVANRTFRERGLKYFARPLVLGLAVVYFCYAFIYSIPVKKRFWLEGEIKVARQRSQFADTYQSLRGRLSEIYAKSPSGKERSNWLTQRLLESLKAEGVISDSILPPEELVQAGVVIQKVRVPATFRFDQLYNWLQRIERLQPAAHILSVDLNKNTNAPGMNTVICEVGTMIPLKRLDQ
ncbi:MAG: hypothetical protein HY549_11430 [Elusimicrobia bacterium]|nr:hypothetical protein [Elusimicrobiota bacterium]